ncbi:hypothetical protein F5Y16DRAFT_26214 [Xylariaceae sp. FL0255]|nr:hypothetical protein F5Y16DRAFT_26214 [Xylariaceae sp. FL0255]
MGMLLKAVSGLSAVISTTRMAPAAKLRMTSDILFHWLPTAQHDHRYQGLNSRVPATLCDNPYSLQTGAIRAQYQERGQGKGRWVRDTSPMWISCYFKHSVVLRVLCISTKTTIGRTRAESTLYTEPRSVSQA